MKRIYKYKWSFILMIISAYFICSNNIITSAIKTSEIVKTTIVVVGATSATYLLFQRVLGSLKLGIKDKIFYTLVTFFMVTFFAVINMRQVLEFSVPQDRCIEIDIGFMQINKVDFVIVMTLFIFPFFSVFITDIVKEKIFEKKKQILICNVIIGLFQMLEFVALFDIRLSTIFMIAIINAVFTSYIMKKKLEVSSITSIIVSSFYGVIAAVFMAERYYTFYSRNTAISLKYYLDTIPEEVKSVFRYGEWFGISKCKIPLVYITRDMYSAIIGAVYYFGYIAGAITAILILVKLLSVYKIYKEIQCTASVATETLTVSITSYLTVKIILNAIYGLFSVTVPVEAIFLFDKIYRHTFTVLGGGYIDLIIVTLLILMNINSRRKVNEK